MTDKLPLPFGRSEPESFLDVWLRMNGPPFTMPAVGPELREIIERLFPPQPYNHYFESRSDDEFRKLYEAFGTVLNAVQTVFEQVLPPGRKTPVSPPERELLKSELVLAALGFAQAHGADRDSIDRLRGQLRMYQARDHKKPGSKRTDEIVRYYAHHYWMRHQGRLNSDQGTAIAIEDSVNAALKRETLDPLGIEAIRKRVRHYRKHIIASQPDKNGTAV